MHALYVVNVHDLRILHLDIVRHVAKRALLYPQRGHQRYYKQKYQESGVLSNEAKSLGAPRSVNKLAVERTASEVLT